MAKKKSRSRKKTTRSTRRAVETQFAEIEAAAVPVSQPNRMTSEDAFDLAGIFRDVSMSIGSHRKSATPSQRNQIFAMESQLLGLSQLMITAAVGLTLDEAQTSLKALTDITEDAKDAIETLQDVRKGIQIATAVIGLAAAVVSGDLGAIVKTTKKVMEAVDE